MRVRAGLALLVFSATLALAGTASVVHAPPATAGPGCGDIPVVSDVCHGVTDPVGTIGGVAGGIASDAAQGVFDALTRWIIDGAKSLVSQVGDFIDRSTKPDPQAAWFQPSYRLMVGVGVAFLLPMLLCAVVGALIRQDVAGAARSAFIKLPIACIGMYAGTTLAGLLVSVSDSFSTFVGSSIGHNGAEFGKGLVDAMVTLGNAGGGVAPALLALFTALMAFVVWVELVIRQAAVMVAVLFLPLGFAALIWPSTARWLRRLVEGLVALVLAKFVITAIIGVGAAAMASGSFSATGFGNVVMGTAILLLATFAPYALFKIIPVAEIGLLAGLEGLSRRPAGAASGAVSHVRTTQTLLAARAAGSAAAPRSVANGNGNGSGATLPSVGVQSSGGAPPVAGVAGGAAATGATAAVAGIGAARATAQRGKAAVGTVVGEGSGEESAPDPSTPSTTIRRRPLPVDRSGPVDAGPDQRRPPKSGHG